MEIPQRRGDSLVLRQDEGFRADVTAESLGKLRAAFKKDGSVTAGNASQISDGASALLVASEKAVSEYGLKPLAEITGYAAGGMAPKWVMMAPKVALENLEKVTGTPTKEYDLMEINEAFSSGACALLKTLELDASKVNVNGGATALGHPIGASGARILTTLLYAMKDRGVQTGAATLCLGGGNAVALSVHAC